MIGNQVVSTMFDINTCIHMDRIIPVRDRDEDPGNFLGTYQCYVPNPGCDGEKFYTLLHRSTLYWSVAMLFFHIVAPLCTISWLQLDRVMEIWIHIVCLVAISLVSTLMDPQCIGRWPCLSPFCPSMGMPTSG
jgi:hypothetical protein